MDYDLYIYHEGQALHPEGGILLPAFPPVAKGDFLDLESLDVSIHGLKRGLVEVTKVIWHLRKSGSLSVTLEVKSEGSKE